MDEDRPKRENWERLHQDYLRMARKWRIDRQQYIIPGGDNAAELEEFAAELEDMMLTILRLASAGILDRNEARRWCAEVHNEWVKLTIYARGSWKHRAKRWMYHG